MALQVTVRDQPVGGREASTLTLELPPRITLRDLVRTRVREEVAKYNAERAGLFRGLVKPEDAKETRAGFTLRPGKTIDWEKQARVAEEAFERNGFFVIVEDRQVEDLDAELELTPETDIRFVKLTPLVGG